MLHTAALTNAICSDHCFIAVSHPIIASDTHTLTVTAVYLHLHHTSYIYYFKHIITYRYVYLYIFSETFIKHMKQA